MPTPPTITDPQRHPALADTALELLRVAEHADAILAALDATYGDRPRSWADTHAGSIADAALAHVRGVLVGAMHTASTDPADRERQIENTVSNYALPYLTAQARRMKEAREQLAADATGRAQTEPELAGEHARWHWAAALNRFCQEYHSGMGSRGYRLLSRLAHVGYEPSFSDEQLRGEQNEPARNLYAHLVARYAETV